LTGQFAKLTVAKYADATATKRLILAEQGLRASKVSLTAATVAQTAATNTLSVAQGRSVAATAAMGTRTAKLSAAFPLLAGVITRVGAAFGSLATAAAANPIGAVVLAIIAAVAALAFFSDKIGVADDGLVTLRDVGIATFQLIGEAVAPVTDLIGSGFSFVIDKTVQGFNFLVEQIGRAFNAIWEIIKGILNGIIGLTVGTINGMVQAWNILPAAIKDVGTIAFNGLIDVSEAAINSIIAAISGLLEFIGSAATLVGLENPFKDLLSGASIDLSEFKGEVTGAAQQVGSVFVTEMNAAMSRDFIGEGFNAILERARKIAAERLANLNDVSGGSTDPSSTTGGGKSFADIIRDLTIQNELLKLNREERERLNATLEIEKQLKRALTEDERALVNTILDENIQLKAQSVILDGLRQPAEDYQTQVQALKELKQQGRITAGEYSQSLRNIRIAYLDTQTDLASGFERGFLKALTSASDFASQAETIVTGAFDKMADGLAEFIQTGKFDFRSLIMDINRQIIKLVISQAFTQLFGGLTGGGAAGAGGGAGGFLGNIFKGLLGAQNGANFTVGSNTSLASIPGVDNRVVAFRAQDGENVSVTPKGETPGGQSGPTIIFNIQTPDVQSFRASESQLAARAARIVSSGNRNM